MLSETIIEDVRAVPGNHKTSYTAQATKRALCGRLASFVRLVDVLVANAMHSLALESLSFLVSYMKRLADQGLDSTPLPSGSRESLDLRRHSTIEIDGKVVVLRRPTIQRRTTHFQPKQEQPERPDTTPLFKVSGQVLVLLSTAQDCVVVHAVACFILAHFR